VGDREDGSDLEAALGSRPELDPAAVEGGALAPAHEPVAVATSRLAADAVVEHPQLDGIVAVGEHDLCVLAVTVAQRVGQRLLSDAVDRSRGTGRVARGPATGRIESSSANCTVVMTVPGGSLTASVGGKAVGKAFAQGLAKGAILGGTGDYAGATGDFASEGEPAVSTFHLFVPKK